MRTLLLFASAAGLFALTACSSTPSCATDGCTDAGVVEVPVDAGTPTHPSDGGPEAPLSCTNPPSADAGTIAAIVQGNTELAFRLFGQLEEEADGGNVFYSPHSVSTALAMTYTGAAGTTATQLAQVLDFPSDSVQDFAAGFGSLGCELVTDGQAPDGGTIALANALFGQKGASFEQSFLDIQSNDFGAPLTPLDFASDPNGSLNEINGWVSQQTDGMIPSLLAPGAVNSGTKLVLADALYFNENWASPFVPSETNDGPFHVTPQQTIIVPLMSAEVTARAYIDTTVAMLELPLQRPTEAIDFLIPSPAGTATSLSAVEAAFTPSAFQGWVAQLVQEEIGVTVPKLKIDERVDMIPPLQALGLSAPFSDANFSGIDGAMDLSISLIQHEAVLQLDEEGVTAAAATAVGLTDAAAQQPQATFTLDQPFLVVIRDVPTGTVLFIGQVTNPSGS